MTWTDNMSKHSEPKVSETSLKSDHVKITFRPDLQRFKTGGLTSDLIALMNKRVYDIAGTTGVKVTLNGERLFIKDFKSYVDLYFLKARLPGTEENCSPGTISSHRGEDEESDGSFLTTSKAKSKCKTEVSEVTNSTTTAGESIVKIHERVNERWEIVVSQSEGQFQQVSFVNSICTTKGGTHVNYVVEPLINALLKKVQTKNKGGIEIKAHNVR